MSRPRVNLWERINEKVAPVYNPEMNSQCMIWTGALNAGGYGRFNPNREDRNDSTLVHRFVYEHFIDKKLHGLEVDHICKNRACCNPNHLRAVSKQENLRNRY